MSLCSIRQSSSKPKRTLDLGHSTARWFQPMAQSITQSVQQALSEWSYTNIVRDCVTFFLCLEIQTPLSLSLSLAKYIGCSADRGMWSATHQTTSLHCMTLFFLTKQIWTNWGVDKSMAVQYIVQPWGTGRHTNTFAVFVSGPVQCKSNFLPEENPNELRCCHCSTAVLVRIQ